MGTSAATIDAHYGHLVHDSGDSIRAGNVPKSRQLPGT